MDFNKAIKEIDELKRPILIGVSGFGGSGKTTLSDILSKRFDAPVISIDRFCKDSQKQDFHIWDIMDYKRFEREVLLPFNKNENPIKYGVFSDGENKIVETKSVSYKDILIVEGVGMFRPNLMKHFSYSIWVDVPLNEAIYRGKKRDREVWKNPKDEMWEGVWKVNDEEYLKEFRPDRLANIVIDNSVRG